MYDESESTGYQARDPHKPHSDVTPMPQDAASPAMRDAACGCSLRVLIVDGTTDAASELARFLRDRGHDVRWTCDGVAALEVAAVHEPQVVLLAIDKLEMDGYKLAQQLRLNARLKKCFFIAMGGSGHTDAWGHEQPSQANIDLVLAKPIDHLVLESLLMWEGERLNESGTPRKLA